MENYKVKLSCSILGLCLGDVYVARADISESKHATSFHTSVFLASVEAMGTVLRRENRARDESNKKARAMAHKLVFRDEKGHITHFPIIESTDTLPMPLATISYELMFAYKLRLLVRAAERDRSAPQSTSTRLKDLVCRQFYTIDPIRISGMWREHTKQDIYLYTHLLPISFFISDIHRREGFVTVMCRIINASPVYNAVCQAIVFAAASFIMLDDGVANIPNVIDNAVACGKKYITRREDVASFSRAAYMRRDAAVALGDGPLMVLGVALWALREMYRRLMSTLTPQKGVLPLPSAWRVFRDIARELAEDSKRMSSHDSESAVIIAAMLMLTAAGDNGMPRDADSEISDVLRVKSAIAENLLPYIDGGITTDKF